MQMLTSDFLNDIEVVSIVGRARRHMTRSRAGEKKAQLSITTEYSK